ncbi:hypothetical protein EJ07DRAFT_156355 [Lizonia empirigonia]|nr:hypothetical protein EJ07DRAFT_156355 [Lizonia empirigonia]
MHGQKDGAPKSVCARHDGGLVPRDTSLGTYKDRTADSPSLLLHGAARETGGRIACPRDTVTDKNRSKQVLVPMLPEVIRERNRTRLAEVSSENLHTARRERRGQAILSRESCRKMHQSTGRGTFPRSFKLLQSHHRCRHNRHLPAYRLPHPTHRKT